MVPFIGMIQTFGFTFAPQGWTFCHGSLLSISQFSALFALLGIAYGGDGRTTFRLPNLVSRAPLGYAPGSPPPGLLGYSLGQLDGSQTWTLNIPELPTHNHVASFTPSGGGTSVKVEASTSIADEKVADTGDYLASGHPATGIPRYIDAAAAGTTVPLGGVIGGESGTGSVILQSAGDSMQVSVQDPALALNFSIALTGIFPSRN